jgi:hypothetical protein
MKKNKIVGVLTPLIIIFIISCAIPLSFGKKEFFFLSCKPIISASISIIGNGGLSGYPGSGTPTEPYINL